MTKTMQLAGRNLRVCFRELSTVALSLFAALVLLVIYVVYLNSNETARLVQTFPYSTTDSVDMFVGTWVFAGALTTICFTTAFSGAGVYIGDRSEGRFKDLRLASATWFDMGLGYLVASFAVSAIMSTLMLAVGAAVLMLALGQPVELGDVWHAERLVLAVSFVFSSISCLIATFSRSRAGFVLFSLVFGIGVGFASGAFLPLGMLPEFLQTVFYVLPFAAAGTLLRIAMSDGSLVAMTGGNRVITEDMRDFYGLHLYIGDLTVSEPIMVVCMLAVGAACAFLALARINRAVQIA